jgi:hypothetical protein
MIRFEKNMLKLNYKPTIIYCLSMSFSIGQKLSEFVKTIIGKEYEYELVPIALQSAPKPPPSTLRSTLPPPAVDSISDKKNLFTDIFFSLNHIFLSRPVSTAGGGIKGGGL